MWQHERWECTAASGESKSRSLHHAAWTLSLSRCYLLRSSKWPSQIAWQTYTLYCAHEHRVSERRQSNEYIFVHEHFYFKLLLITRQWINNKLKCIIATLIYEYALNLVLSFSSYYLQTIIWWIQNAPRVTTIKRCAVKCRPNWINFSNMKRSN